MSQQSFVEYYEQFLLQPENEALRQELEAAPSREAFNQIALRQGQENGFDFDIEDMNLVMYTSEKKAIEESGELSDAQLDAVAGGMTAFTTNLSSTSLLDSAQTVSIRTVPTFDAGAVASTIMCCW